MSDRILYTVPGLATPVQVVRLERWHYGLRLGLFESSVDMGARQFRLLGANMVSAACHELAHMEELPNGTLTMAPTKSKVGQRVSVKAPPQGRAVNTYISHNGRELGVKLSPDEAMSFAAALMDAAQEALKG